METITAAILALFIMLWFVAPVLVFPRQSRNVWNMIKNRKSYVVVHLKKSGTDFQEIYLVKPDPDRATQIGKMNYTLAPRFALFKFKGRLHFLVDEFDAVPKHFSEDAKQDIIFQAHEIQAALTNNVVEQLFRKQVLIYFILLAAVAAVAFVVILYDVYQIQNIQKVIQSIPFPATEVR